MVRVHPRHPAAPPADACSPGRARHHGRLRGGLIARALVLGGTRSGKSAYAEGMLDPTGPALYVATARGVDPTVDPEWADRVAAHRDRRPAHWRTVEDADLPGVLAAEPGGPVLVDDLATWVTGLLDDAGWARDAPSVAEGRERLVAAVSRFEGHLVLVSAEVGLGVVPSTSAGRRFRDELGALNQALAAVCDEVWLLVAGLPLRLG